METLPKQWPGGPGFIVRNATELLVSGHYNCVLRDHILVALMNSTLDVA